MTQKNRSSLSTRLQFEKKLAAYTLVGAAALVAPNVAKASGITYFGNVDVTVNAAGTYNFNLSGPSSDDITIMAALGGGPVPASVTAATGTGAAVLEDGTPPANVAALSLGAVIDPSNADFGTGTNLVMSKPGKFSGDWPTNGGQAYLGFYFNGPSNPQAGWALISTSSSSSASSFEILSYAYQDAPNTAITAGDTGGSTVPEPSSMALLALGGAGLLALRKRRAARNS